MGNSSTSKSIYRRGAEDGAIFGVYLSVLFIVTAMSMTGMSMLASLAGLALIVAVPAVIYVFLRRSYFADERRSTFSALWLHGICIFFFGSLLMALTSYVYMRILHPEFIPEMLAAARSFYDSLGTDEGREMVKMIDQVVKNHLYPTPGEASVEIIWTAVATGSILSMLLSLVVRAIYRRPVPTDNRF